MAQRSVHFTQGGYFHVYNRGCGRENIFRESENYNYLLRIIRNKLPLYRITIIAYCFMPNYYHFILRQDNDIPAGNFIQNIFNSYSKAFNKRYGRTGTLFEGPFQAKYIIEQEYLVHLCRYVHRNPVDAGLVKSPEKWPFSDYCDWIGLRENVFIDKDFITNNFSTTKEYESFVKDYTPPSKLKFGLDKYSIH
jgi:putative transposase